MHRMEEIFPLSTPPCGKKLPYIKVSKRSLSHKGLKVAEHVTLWIKTKVIIHQSSKIFSAISPLEWYLIKGLDSPQRILLQQFPGIAHDVQMSPRLQRIGQLRLMTVHQCRVGYHHKLFLLSAAALVCSSAQFHPLHDATGAGMADDEVGILHILPERGLELIRVAAQRCIIPVDAIKRYHRTSAILDREGGEGAAAVGPGDVRDELGVRDRLDQRVELGGADGDKY